LTTARQQDANRKNALRSCGPRTPEGKQHSRNNAHQHGLATRIGSAHAERLRINHIASKLAAGSNDTWAIDHARHVAECQVHLERVKAAAAQATRKLADTDPYDREQVKASLKLLMRLEPYERKARSRRKSAISAFRSAILINED
jgi:hypothetical protein